MKWGVYDMNSYYPFQLYLNPKNVFEKVYNISTC